MRIWRRVRGILGVSVTWGVVWGVLGSALSAALLWWTSRHDAALEMPGVVASLPTMFVFWSTLGAFSGAVFATLLLGFERRRSVDTLAGRRVAVWGALGGATLPLVVIALGGLDGRLSSDWLLAPLISGTLGAVCATASLRLARQTPGAEQSIVKSPTSQHTNER